MGYHWILCQIKSTAWQLTRGISKKYLFFPYICCHVSHSTFHWVMVSQHKKKKIEKKEGVLSSPTRVSHTHLTSLSLTTHKDLSRLIKGKGEKEKLSTTLTLNDTYLSFPSTHVKNALHSLKERKKKKNERGKDDCSSSSSFILQHIRNNPNLTNKPPPKSPPTSKHTPFPTPSR